jgi:hypothetical protein
MECAECHAPTDRERGWDVGDGKLLCMACFRAMGQKALAVSEDVVAGDRKKILRRWAKEEYAESVPREIISPILEEVIRRVLTQEDPRVAMGNGTTRVQLVTAMQVEQAKVEVVRGLRTAVMKGLDDLEHEARENMRKLRSLGAES